MRKTVDREVLVRRANNILAADETMFPRLNREVREAIFAFVSGLLHETGSYKGFSYIYPHQMDNPSETPGINGLVTELGYEEAFRDTDNSRIFFN
jgi:hypothetical protein